MFRQSFFLPFISPLNTHYLNHICENPTKEAYIICAVCIQKTHVMSLVTSRKRDTVLEAVAWSVSLTYSITELTLKK